MAFNCKICGKRVYGNNWGRCFGHCKRVLCTTCLIEHRCIDCYVEIEDKDLVIDYIRLINKEKNPVPNER